MPSAFFPPPDPPQNHAKMPPEGCSLGHRTVVICGCCGGLFWKRPSPYCCVLQIWGGVWMPIGWHRGLFLPLWVFVQTTRCASQLASWPLPKSAKHNSTVTGASKTDPDNTRKSPQYGGQVSTPREALLRGFGEGREAGRGPKTRPNLLSSPPSAGWSPAKRPLTRAMPRGDKMHSIRGG